MLPSPTLNLPTISYSQDQPLYTPTKSALLSFLFLKPSQLALTSGSWTLLCPPTWNTTSPETSYPLRGLFWLPVHASSPLPILHPTRSMYTPYFFFINHSLKLFHVLFIGWLHQNVNFMRKGVLSFLLPTLPHPGECLVHRICHPPPTPQNYFFNKWVSQTSALTGTELRNHNKCFSWTFILTNC